MSQMALSEVLEQLPAGVAVLDPSLEITWCNDRLRELAQWDRLPIGETFYDLLGTPEILGPDLCPFHTAIGHILRSRWMADSNRAYRSKRQPRFACPHLHRVVPRTTVK